MRRGEEKGGGKKRVREKCLLQKKKKKSQLTKNLYKDSAEQLKQYLQLSDEQYLMMPINYDVHNLVEKHEIYVTVPSNHSPKHKCTVFNRVFL